MHFHQSIKRDDLALWVDDYLKSIADDKNETKSAMISLKVLDQLVQAIRFYNYEANKTYNEARAKGKADAHLRLLDGIRIYLARQQDGYKLLTTKNGPQIQFVIVPTCDFKLDGDAEKGEEQLAEAENYWRTDETTFGIMPGPRGENSGMCPPSCGGSIIKPPTK